MNKRNFTAFCLACAVLAGVFLVDLVTPLDMASWVVYLLVPAIASLWLSRGQTIALTVIDTVLMFVGHRFSPPGVGPTIAYLNRFIGVIVLWAVVAILIRYRQTQRILMESEAEARKTAEEIRLLNASLAERAIELEAANRELETFNYTVSHDLRKPLTIINSSCQVIQELCGDGLSEQCKGLVQYIHDGTMRMNQMIDALLDFSRMTRTELNRETVDLSRMVKEIAAELMPSESERRVTFRVTDGVVVNGDRKLLRVLLDNLIGNAWKYSRMQEDAVIEFGMNEIDGKQVCFVRDNGAGFDMTESEKLFLPFQRLSGTESYEGHGIGLATVQRIIERHNGRIWAESERAKGATFYFTLPADKAA